MGFLDDTASLISGRTSHSHHHHKSSSKSHKRHKSRSRSASPSRRHSSHQEDRGLGSIFGLGGGNESSSRHHHRRKSSGGGASFFEGLAGAGAAEAYRKHSASRSGFFNLGNGNASRGSFFGGFGRTPSYYKRSPRSNFVTRAYRHLKRLLRDLVYYARKHPVKVFMLVLMPLVTGGALTALLARFGLRLPAGFERMLGLGAKAMSGDGIGLVGEAVRMASGAAAASSTGFGSARIEKGRQGDFQWERRSVEKDGGWGDGLMGFAKQFM